MPNATTTFVMELSARHRFPVDMLRYDCCWPSASDDARKIESSFAQFGNPTPLEIVLITDRSNRPTVGRWESFGCTFKGVVR